MSSLWQKIPDMVAANQATRPHACWLWKHATVNGYGLARPPKAVGGSALVHRRAYELTRGPIPAGAVLDHLCRNRACFNPDHLEAVSEQTNLLRGEGWAGRNARRTECPKGHALTGDNLRITNRGERRCRECDRIRARDYFARNRERMNAARRAYYSEHEAEHHKTWPYRGKRR